MKSAGIDIGSRTIEFVILDDGEIIFQNKMETTINPLVQLKQILTQYSSIPMVATGYGRQLAMTNFPCQTITEIKAYALAAKFLHPQVKAIIDIGGQDTKAILLDDKNNIKKFEMNDKCAAGTGKFLEIMALTLGVTIEELGPLALTSDSTLTINNTCTVFAESEVISLLTQGQSINNIANAIHHLVAHKAVSLINRVAPSEDTILFAGGVAHNPAVVALLKKLTNRNIIIPQLPEYMGAIGAAIAAKQE